MPDPVHPDALRLECDLIMKGGVTSGLVYPAAIAEIARSYRLRCIGGTSAGAIAAAAAAAMEFGRQTSRDPARQRALPDELLQLSNAVAEQRDGITRLDAMFSADDGLQPLFADLKRTLRGEGAIGLRTIIAAGSSDPWLVPYLATMLGILLAVPLLAGWLLAVPFQAPVLLALLFSLLTLLAAAWWVVPAVLGHIATHVAALWVNNGLGFATGMAAADKGHAVPLLQWLHDTLQRLSGLPETSVLSFGHLWLGHRHDAAQPVAANSEAGREIDLVLVATDLNRLQSVNFPFLPERSRLFIDQRQWQRLFPAPVLAAIRNNSLGPAGKKQVAPDFFSKVLRYREADVEAAAAACGDPQLHENLLLLPDAADIPVIVAVRASLAFPGLFTPLPLLLLHWTMVDGQRVARFSPILLADGGITSNFPIHLFDAPIPSRPTFAINLLYPDDIINADPFTGGPRDSDDDSEMEGMAGGGGGAPSVRNDIFMPNSNSGRVLLYKAPSAGTPLARFAGLALRVVEAARTWGDVSLYNQPGVRDRIVHVRLTDSEGGFNLGMSPETIAAIAAKGALAGRVLTSRFHPIGPSDPLHPGQPVRLNWHNHRFVRLRAFLAAQELLGNRATAAWARAIDAGITQSRPGLDTILRTAGTADARIGVPIGYSDRLTGNRRAHMAAIIADLARFAPPPPQGNGSSNSAAEGAPSPRSRLQLRPGGTDPAATRS